MKTRLKFRNSNFFVAVIQMPFSAEQFHKNATRLQVVVMSRLDKPPLTNYTLMNPKERRLFDAELNTYIRQLPLGLEDDTIQEDFNRVCQEEVFPTMKPERHVLERSTPAEIEASEPNEEVRKLFV